MTGGTEFSEVQETIKETPEVAEAKQQLDRATIEPAAQLEKVGDVKQSEDLEKEVAAAVEAAPKLETPPAITLEGAGEAGKMTIESATDPVAIIDTNDREVMAAEAAADGGRTTEDRVEAAADETVMIDTVPFPERPAAAAEAGSRESIGTWPTPDSGGQDVQAEGASPTDTEENFGQDELKAGEYDIHFEISGDTPDSGEFSRADVSTVEVDVGVGITTTADDTGQLAGVEAGAIATVEADASTAKTIGTEASQGSGIPIAERGDTADGASPGGMEVGSVEEAEQIMPETDEEIEKSYVNIPDERSASGDGGSQEDHFSNIPGINEILSDEYENSNTSTITDQGVLDVRDYQIAEDIEDFTELKRLEDLLDRYSDLYEILHTDYYRVYGEITKYGSSSRWEAYKRDDGVWTINNIRANCVGEQGLEEYRQNLEDVRKAILDIKSQINQIKN